jgi:three-Cys-motif partner protein
MTKDINFSAFSEATLLKLKIFAECFREWFPVFVYYPSVKLVHIFDFFAGSGKDVQGNYGSPLILLQEAKGSLCSVVRKNGKEVCFTFNEKEETKKDELKNNVTAYINKCRNSSCRRPGCIYKIVFGQSEFKDIFNNDDVKKVLSNPKAAKFILLDQYGFSQVDEDVFMKLVDSPITDFIFLFHPLL